MNTNLPGTCFTVIEAGDIQIKTSQNFKNKYVYSSVYEYYQLHSGWWKNTELVLKQSSSIATSTGFASLISIYKNSPYFDKYLSLYLSCPAAFKSFEVWALLQVIQETEFKFLETCSKPNIEISLTSALIQILDCKSELIQAKYSKSLSITGTELSVSKLELQVQNREKRTGGDFALLFEWKDESGAIKICPIVFQAKRVISLDADISQHNKNVGYQFNILSMSKCNPVYIFYNCDSTCNTATPRLPTVKRVSDIKIKEEPINTNTIEQVLSFSMFILDIMSSDKYFVTNSRKSALNEILPGVDQLELSNIVTFSVDPSALIQYKKEYKNYLEQKELINDH